MKIFLLRLENKHNIFYESQACEHGRQQTGEKKLGLDEINHYIDYRTTGQDWQGLGNVEIMVMSHDVVKCKHIMITNV
jgi:hypothetical protein